MPRYCWPASTPGGELLRHRQQRGPECAVWDRLWRNRYRARDGCGQARRSKGHPPGATGGGTVCGAVRTASRHRCQSSRWRASWTRAQHRSPYRGISRHHSGGIAPPWAGGVASSPPSARIASLDRKTAPSDRSLARHYESDRAPPIPTTAWRGSECLGDQLAHPMVLRWIHRDDEPRTYCPCVAASLMARLKPSADDYVSKSLYGVEEDIGPYPLRVAPLTVGAARHECAWHRPELGVALAASRTVTISRLAGHSNFRRLLDR
jgi:hypothetical protein